jgi:Helicase conserved C-terminal domain
MPQGALTVQQDGTLTVERQPDKDTAALEAILSSFADPVCPTADQRVYRITAASIWRARRAGLTLEEILQPQETSSPMKLPPPVREISRGGATRSTASPWKSTRAACCCGVPIPWPSMRCGVIARSGPSSSTNLMPSRWHSGLTPIRSWSTPLTPVAIRFWTACPPGGRRAVLVEGMRQLPRQCQATTKAGRPCKNRWLAWNVPCTGTFQFFDPTSWRCPTPRR